MPRTCIYLKKKKKKKERPCSADRYWLNKFLVFTDPALDTQDRRFTNFHYHNDNGDDDDDDDDDDGNDNVKVRLTQLLFTD